MPLDVEPAATSMFNLTRPYFDDGGDGGGDGLVRSAQTGPVLDMENDVVSVPRSEYNELLNVARKYASLRRSLINGGVTDEAIALLSGETQIVDPTPTTPSPVSARKNSVDVGIAERPIGAPKQPSSYPHSPPHQHPHHHSHPHAHPHARTGYYHPPSHDTYPASPKAYRPTQRQPSWAGAMPPSPDDASFSADVPDAPEVHGDTQAGFPNPAAARPPRPQFDRLATRSVAILGLPEGVTYADLTNAIRGGPVLEVILRTNVSDKTATVSFLHAADAKNFYDCAKRHALCIKSKRVDVRWADRQFILSNHVANKVGIGATRNLIIRRCDARLTEDQIREDMEHIHNLVVIKVEFVGGSCRIATNSIHNALFARTCMMSRALYKGSKIDWDVDECAQAQPIDKASSFSPPKARRDVRAPPRRKSPSVTTNRFQLLDLDDVEDDETDAGVVLDTTSRVGIQV